MIILSSTTQRLNDHRLMVCLLLAIVFASTLHAEAPQAAKTRMAEILPKSIVGIVELSDFGSVIEKLLNHPLRASVETMSALQAMLKSDGLAQLKQGIAAFEAGMEQSWPDALTTLTDGGVTIAVDASERGVVVLVNSSDEEKLVRFRDFLLAIRSMQRGKFSPAKQSDYRGFTAYALNDEFKLAVMDNWLLISNKSLLAKSIVDRYLDRTDDSLEKSNSFSRAMAEIKSTDDTKPKPWAVGFIDVQTLREVGIPKSLYNEKIDNPVVELVLGGVLASLRHTPYATAMLNIETNQIDLQVAMPHDRDWEPPREYYFGSPDHAVSPPLLEIEDRLFAISSHRDISQMWLRAGDLLTDKANEGLTKADTQLTTFFSGRDFGEDILGSFGSDIQIVGKNQDFTDILPRPAIKLPAFALQLQMKNPSETTRELRRVFQSFVGFLNVTGAMNGRPQLDLNMESIGSAQLVTATYVPDRDKGESTSAPINFNFSPTIAFIENRILLSSSTALAKELVGRNESTAKATTSHNTSAIVEADRLQQVLKANRSQLVANNMLEKGHGKEAAEGEIGLLLDLVGFFKDANVNLDVMDSQLRLSARLSLDSESTK